MSEHLTLEAVDADGATGRRTTICRARPDEHAATRVARRRHGGRRWRRDRWPAEARDGRAVAVAGRQGPELRVDARVSRGRVLHRAVAGGALSGELLKFAKTVKAHEVAHVAFLKSALGAKAVKKPTFDFKGTTDDPAKFQATAIVLEDTGVAAYNGQGANLTKAVLAAAASIVSVEARHAAWIRDIAKKNPAPAAFDAAKTSGQVLSAVKATGFITG